MTSIIKVDQIQTAAGGVPTAADLGLNVSGAVLQVKHFQMPVGQIYSSTNNAWLAVGCSVSITPSSSSSKILVLVSGSTISNNTASYAVRVQRNGTVVGLHEMYSNTPSWTGDSVSLTIYDTPNTTSQLTYLVEMLAGSGSGNQMRYNYTNGLGSQSTITAIEIAG